MTFKGKWSEDEPFDLTRAIKMINSLWGEIHITGIGAMKGVDGWYIDLTVDCIPIPALRRPQLVSYPLCSPKDWKWLVSNIRPLE